MMNTRNPMKNKQSNASRLPCLAALLGISFLAMGLTGCTIFPGAGPSTSDMLSTAYNHETPDFALVDINANVVRLLDGRKHDSFLTTFDDYRPSPEPRVGIGDAISLTIWEAAAGGLFSGPIVSDRMTPGSRSATIPEQTVGRDGSITVPYAGRIRVQGLTQAELQIAIEKALNGKAIQPQVLATVTRPLSKSVTVTGEVTTGGRIPLSDGGDRLLDVIAQAGGIKAPVNETFLRLQRGGKTASVSLLRVVSDPKENIFLRPGDTVTLVRTPQRFLAYGATGRNAEIPFESDDLTLAQALTKAGGLIDTRADPEGVFVIRFEMPSIYQQLQLAMPTQVLGHKNRVPVIYRLNMRDPSSLVFAQRFRIFNDDMIYVTNSPFNDMQKAMQLFFLVSAPVGTAAAFYGLSK